MQVDAFTNGEDRNAYTFLYNIKFIIQQLKPVNVGDAITKIDKIEKLLAKNRKLMFAINYLVAENGNFVPTNSINCYSVQVAGLWVYAYNSNVTKQLQYFLKSPLTILCCSSCALEHIVIPIDIKIVPSVNTFPRKVKILSVLQNIFLTLNTIEHCLTFGY